MPSNRASACCPACLQNGDHVAILGTPGGSRIITMVLLALLEAVEGRDAQAWVSLPRFHHQYLPDVIEVEPGAFSDELKKVLRERGHVLDQKTRPWGNMQAIHWNRKENKVEAASDPRGGGLALLQSR